MHPRNAGLRRVILVEDNPGDADLVLDALARVGDPCDVRHVERVSECIEALQQAPADVVLLDLNLPDASGLEALQRVRQAAPALPIVVLTGLDDEATGQKALHEGAQDYIVKGVAGPAELLRTIRYAVERQQHAERARLLSAEAAARAVAEEARARTALVADVSTLLGSTLNLQTTLPKALGRLSAGFAESCAVEIAGRNETVFRFDDPAPSATDGGLPSLATMPTGSHAALAGTGPALVLPISLRGERVGLLALARAPGRPPFSPDECALAEEIARRIASAADNARLFEGAIEAVRMRDDFLAVAGHELRTPLSALIMSADALARRYAGDPQVGKPVSLVKRAALRLSQLVDELVDVSRLSTGRMQLEPTELDLAALVRDTASELTAADDRARGLMRICTPERLVGTWDRARMRGVVTNLLTNALKFGRGEPIDVMLTSSDGAAKLLVRDYGIGIAAEDRVRIFERYERAVSSRNYGGLGLGLWICRQTVEAHGGTITVERPDEGGSAFIVTLPCDPCTTSPSDDTTGSQTGTKAAPPP